MTMNGRAGASRAVSGPLASPHTRQHSSRTHSQSLSLGSISSPHRIDRRRKSTSSNNPATSAAVLGLVAEHLKDQRAAPKRAEGSGKMSSEVSCAISLPLDNAFDRISYSVENVSAVIDGPSLAVLRETSQQKPLIRRASEGPRSVTGDGKRQGSGHLRCEHCGKSYKHSSCLYKHLWEHTPEWAITSKLLISKHQQVQLLEAASVLVQMNQNSMESEGSSPEATCWKSSSNATNSEAGSPPPYGRSETPPGGKDLGSSSSICSRSYQSSLCSDTNRSTAHLYSLNDDGKPASAVVSHARVTDEAREEMSAAFNLLSCSLGATCKPGMMRTKSSSIPPVPQLPEQYTRRRMNKPGSGAITRGFHDNEHTFLGRYSDDVNMLDDNLSSHTSPHSADDDEEGMFGRMED